MPFLAGNQTHRSRPIPLVVEAKAELGLLQVWGWLGVEEPAERGTIHALSLLYHGPVEVAACGNYQSGDAARELVVHDTRLRY